MTKVTYTSVLTSITAMNRLILLKCNPKILNESATSKSVFDSSFATRLQKLRAINSVCCSSQQTNNPVTPCPEISLSDIADYDDDFGVLETYTVSYLRLPGKRTNLALDQA